MYFQNLVLYPLYPFKTIEIITFVLTAIFLIARHSSLHFVNIFTENDLIYDLRAKKCTKCRRIGDY